LWTWLRRLAATITGKTGKPSRLDTATRMAMEADFSARPEPARLRREPEDPIDELKRLVAEPEAPDEPKRRQAPGSSGRRPGGR
jgi:hypothetical protein